MRVVQEACSFTPTSAVIVIEGDTMEAVTGTEARKLAVQTAAGRLGSCGAGDTTNSAYPVDADGNSDDAILLGRPGAAPVAAYRCDHRINARM